MMKNNELNDDDLFDVLWEGGEISSERSRKNWRRDKKAKLGRDQRREMVFRLRLHGMGIQPIASALNVASQTVKTDILAAENLHYTMGNIPLPSRKVWLGRMLHCLRLLQTDTLKDYQHAEENTPTKRATRHSLLDLFRTEIELMTRVGVVSPDLALSASETDTDDDLSEIPEGELRLELMKYLRREIEADKTKVIDIPLTRVRTGAIIKRQPPSMEIEEDGTKSETLTGSSFGLGFEEDE